MLFSLNLSAVETEYSSESVIPAALDQIDEELRSHLSFAAQNSWHMNLQNILVDRSEGTSSRWSASKSTKVRASLSSGYEDESSGGIASTGFKFRYNISAVKPLYHWGATKADHQYGQILLDNTKLGRSLSFLNLYRKLVYSFIDVAVSKQQAKYQQLSLSILEEDLELYRGQVERGEVSSDVLANEQLKYDRADLAFQSLQNRIAKLEDAFRNDAGMETGIPIAPSFALPPAASNLSSIENQVQAFIAEIGGSSLRIKDKQNRVDLNDQFIKKYKVNNRPKIDGIISFRQDSETLATGNRNDLELKEAFGGIQFSWSIFDGGSTRGLVRETMNNKRQLERELMILKESIVSELEYYMTDLRIFSQQSVLDEAQLTRDIAAYKQTVIDVKEGRASGKTAKQFERNVETAKYRLFQTRAQYHKTLTNLYVSMESPAILNYLD